jgi:hypothetical protein
MDDNTASRIGAAMYNYSRVNCFRTSLLKNLAISLFKCFPRSLALLHCNNRDVHIMRDAIFKAAPRTYQSINNKYCSIFEHN